MTPVKWLPEDQPSKVQWLPEGAPSPPPSDTPASDPGSDFLSSMPSWPGQALSGFSKGLTTLRQPFDTAVRYYSGQPLTDESLTPGSLVGGSLEDLATAATHPSIRGATEFLTKPAARLTQKVVDLGTDPTTWALIGTSMVEKMGAQAASFIGPLTPEKAVQFARLINLGSQARVVGKTAAAVFTPQMALGVLQQANQAMEKIDASGGKLTPDALADVVGAGFDAYFTKKGGEHLISKPSVPEFGPRTFENVPDEQAASRAAEYRSARLTRPLPEAGLVANLGSDPQRMAEIQNFVNSTPVSSTPPLTSGERASARTREAMIEWLDKSKEPTRVEPSELGKVVRTPREQALAQEARAAIGSGDLKPDKEAIRAWLESRGLRVGGPREERIQNTIGIPQRVADKVSGQTDSRLINELATTLYKGDIGTVIAKEALQNAVDAIPKGKQGKISVTANIGTKTIVVQDDGIGMTPEVASTEFLNPGGSYKPEGKRGELGLAKIAMFGNSDEILATTVTDVGGKKVQTRLSGRGEEWLNREGGLDRVVEDVPPDTPTGTRVEFQLNPKVEMTSWAYENYARLFQESSRLPHDTRFYVVDKFGDPYKPRELEPGTTKYDYASGKDIPLEKPKDFASLNIPGADIIIRGSGRSTEQSGVNVNILNQGLPQFSTFVRLGRKVKFPQDLEADITPTVSTTDPSNNYPFLPNREGLREKAETAIADYLSKSLLKEMSEKEREAYQTALKSGPIIYGDVRVVDATGQISGQTLRMVAVHPFINYLSRHIENYLSASAEEIGTTKPKFGGLGYHPEWYGTNLHGERLTGKAGAPNEILINIWKIAARAQEVDPTNIARATAERLWGTTTHELLHQLEQSHEENFSSLMTENFPRLMSRGLQFISKAQDVLSKPGVIDTILKDGERLNVEGSGSKEDVFGTAGTRHTPEEPPGETNLGPVQEAGTGSKGAPETDLDIAPKPWTTETGAAKQDILMVPIKVALKMVSDALAPLKKMGSAIPYRASGFETILAGTKNINKDLNAIYMASLASRIPVAVNNLLNAGVGYGVLGSISDAVLWGAGSLKTPIPLGGWHFATGSESKAIAQEAGIRFIARFKNSREAMLGALDIASEFLGKKSELSSKSALQSLTKFVPGEVANRAWHLFSNEVPVMGEPGKTRPPTYAERYSRFMMVANIIQEASMRTWIARTELAPFMERNGLKTLPEMEERMKADPKFREEGTNALVTSLSEALKITAAEGPTSHNVLNTRITSLDTRSITKVLNSLYLPFKLMLTDTPFANYMVNNAPQMFYEAGPLSLIIPYMTKRVRNSLVYPKLFSDFVDSQKEFETKKAFYDSLVQARDQARAEAPQGEKGSVYQSHTEGIQAAREEMVQAGSLQAKLKNQVRAYRSEGLRSASQMANHLAWGPILASVGYIMGARAVVNGDKALSPYQTTLSDEKDKGKIVKNLQGPLGPYGPHYALGVLMAKVHLNALPPSNEEFQYHIYNLFEQILSSKFGGQQSLKDLFGPFTEDTKKSAADTIVSKISYELGRNLISMGPYANVGQMVRPDPLERAGQAPMTGDVMRYPILKRVLGYDVPPIFNQSAFARGAMSNYPGLSKSLPPKYNPASGELRANEAPIGSFFAGKVSRLAPVDQYIQAHQNEFAPGEVLGRQKGTPTYDKALMDYTKLAIEHKVLPLIQNTAIPDGPAKVLKVKMLLQDIRNTANIYAQEQAMKNHEILPPSITESIEKSAETEQLKKDNRSLFPRHNPPKKPDEKLSKPEKRELRGQVKVQWLDEQKARQP